MKTQISRSSFSEDNRFSGVYQQMGRMITDGDWNELSDLLKFQLVDTVNDIIGSGSPRKRGVVHPSGTESFELRWGHIYVDGIHAKVFPEPGILSPQLSFNHQADFPGAPQLTAGQHRLYLDVWERTVTALEEPELMDQGLKGADTCTRTQTMAQVKACDLSISLNDIQNNEAINPSIGNIPVSLKIRQGQTVKDPCDPCADELALQEEVGNYLFRIEVHDVEWSAEPIPEITALVLKWSSENGAEQYFAGQTPPGFESNNWCYEFFSGPIGESGDYTDHMTTEKHLGHHLASGFTPIRGELFDGYPNSEPANLTLVRRWDGFIRLENSGGIWTVAEGADRGREISTTYGDTDHAYVDLSGPVVVNLNNTVLTVDLNSPLALAGDFWQVAIRQAIHSAGSELLNEALPTGIQHHYFVLGTVDINDESEITAFSPERNDVCTPFNFPSLVDIKAKDVCYENSACEMPNVRTVQDAIDFLCRSRDLRWHNKHLHGTGVVCGLKVQCGPDTFPDEEGGEPERRTITVTEGYAIGCEGDDLVLDSSRDLDVMTEIENLQQQSDKPVLDESGNGTLCLYIDIGENGQAELKVEPYDPKIHDQGIFDGTIWVDFFQECVKGLLDDIKKELGNLNYEDIAEAEAENGELISPQRKKFVTLYNLIAYFLAQPHGQYVFTSHKEHIILRNFYLRLREILQSRTFCGMLKGEDFPDYPFMDQETGSLQTGMTTYFGKNHHEKLLTHDSGQFLISYGGPDTTINIFNTEKETLVGVAEVPSGEGGQVTAATFSNDGNLFYAAVDLNGTDSILSRGRFKDGEIIWETSAVLCNVRVADLHFDPSVDTSILMVGFYEGLYVLSLEKAFGAEKVVPAPTYTFNALGQVAYDFFARTLYATSSSSDSATPDRYNSIAVVNLSEAFANAEGSPEEAAEFPLMDVQGELLYGDDDIAVSQANDDGQNQLYVVVDNPNSGKSLLSYVSPNPGRDVVVTDRYSGLPDTEIRLAYHNNSQVLILALEDHFCLQVFSGGKLMTERVPVQLLPSDVAVEQNKGMVYALNYAGNTVSVIPPSELDVSRDFNSDLKNYRLQVIMAFVALFGNLLQNLKDCFCHLLLVQCPSCTDKEKVWLASITIKDNEVYKICNIGKRKEVLTFPKFEYWLSIIPILPILKTGFSKVCCAIFPNIFGNLLDKYRETEDEREYSLVRGRTYKQAVRTSKRTDTAVLFRENTQTVGLMSKLVTDRVLYQQQAASGENIALSKQQYRNMQTTEAVQQMEQQGVQVKVEEYREAQAGRILQKYQQTPKNIPKDSEVTVYQKNGKVLFYAVEKSAPVTAEISETQLSELEVRKQALQDMQEVNESLARVESRKQAVAEMAEVKNQLTKLQEEKNKAQEEVAVLNEQLVALKGEREKTVTDMKELQDGVAQLNSNLQIMKVEITKERSVKEISAVDGDSELLLKEEGIVTINDLANTDSATLEARGIEKEKATLMVNEAKSKISLLP